MADNKEPEDPRPTKRFRMDGNVGISLFQPFPLQARGGGRPREEEDDGKVVLHPGPIVDLSAQQMHDLSKVEFGPDVVDLDLMENRLREFTSKITDLKKLEVLCVRQNLFKDASAVQQFHSKATLRELVMHDNLLTQLPSFEGFTHLTKVDFSFNEIKSMAPVTSLEQSGETLKELYLASNKIATIEGLEKIPHVQILELGSNRIRSLEGLRNLANLRDLWLGRNRIADLAGLQGLTSLVKISLQSNRLETMRGLEACTNLEEIYLSHNGITKIEGLETLNKLRVLDVGNNRIQRVEGLDNQKELTDLWINDNRLEDIEHLNTALKVQRYSVTVIYLEGNPVARRPEVNVKARIMDILPNLCQLDSDLVK